MRRKNPKGSKIWGGGGDRDGESAVPDPVCHHLTTLLLLKDDGWGKKMDLEPEKRVGLKCECE